MQEIEEPAIEEPAMEELNQETTITRIKVSYYSPADITVLLSQKIASTVDSGRISDRWRFTQPDPVLLARLRIARCRVTHRGRDYVWPGLIWTPSTSQVVMQRREKKKKNMWLSPCRLLLGLKEDDPRN